MTDNEEKQAGRPRKFDPDTKIKTTITFELKHILALDAACLKVLELTGEVIDRGDILRWGVERVIAIGDKIDKISSVEEFKDLILAVKENDCEKTIQKQTKIDTKEAEPQKIADEIPEPFSEASDEETVRITFRVPNELLKQIDEARKEKLGRIARNQWLIEQIAKAFDGADEEEKIK